MCRFTFYHGPPLSLSSLITEPENSLIHQSFESSEREEPLNGDGFGIAWYGANTDAAPGLFRSVTPAWNNANLTSLARVVSSSCVLAHVRAATQVRSVSEVNCHPFSAGRYAFMHNGDLGGFGRLRRSLLSELSDEAFASIQGQTDSEHIFALLLDELAGTEVENAGELADAVQRTFERALELSRAHGNDNSYLNVAITDGRSAVVTRFTTDTGYDGESLYWNSGRRYVCDGGLCRMVTPESSGAAILVSSERLSSDPGWEAVPRNHMLLIEPDRSHRLEPLRI